VKELLKSESICQSYAQMKQGPALDSCMPAPKQCRRWFHRFISCCAQYNSQCANCISRYCIPYIPAHFYHWERERAERERHDRAGKERGRERREGEGLIRLVNEARERRSRDQNVRSRPKHIRSRRRPECLTYHATYMCKYISLSCCEINIRGRMHDADVSASLRLKLTYDGLAD